MVLLSGEAGIGKSRLVRALRERLGGEPHTPLGQFCSPYHANTALHPVIGLLERAAGLRREDPPERQLDKLEAMLALAVEDVREAAPLLADLLGIPAGGRYPPLELSPQQRKERTFQALLDQLAGLAARAAGAGALRGRALGRPDHARAAGPGGRAGRSACRCWRSSPSGPSSSRPGRGTGTSPRSRSAGSADGRAGRWSGG